MKLKKRELLKMSKFAELDKVEYGMIRFYGDLDLLSFFHHDRGLIKYYSAKKSNQRFEEILRLRQKWQTMADIILINNYE